MFSSKTTLIALVLVLGSTSSGFARDDIENYSIKHALETADAKEKLDPKIKLSFGNWKHGAVVKVFWRMEILQEIERRWARQ